MRMEQLLFADENAPEWEFSKRKGVICWDIIDQKTHICCNICDIRMHAKCDRKYRELTTTSKACPHCRQLGTQTICISITKEV